MIDFENLKKSAAAVADSALKTTKDLAQKGKLQVDRLALENKLRKAQEQLGAVVYSLHRTGESNDALVARYIGAIEEVEAELAALGAPAQAAEEAAGDVQGDVKICPSCGAEVDPEATFCSVCGAKL